MKKEIGLWIDHRETTIITLDEDGAETKHVISNMGKHVRYSGSAHSVTPGGLKEVTSEDRRDRKFENQLNQYYDEIIALIRDADSIQVFGPGEAKGELVKLLEQQGLKDRILRVEAEDKLTDRQIAAKMREHLPA